MLGGEKTEILICHRAKCISHNIIFFFFGQYSWHTSAQIMNPYVSIPSYSLDRFKMDWNIHRQSILHAVKMHEFKWEYAQCVLLPGSRQINVTCLKVRPESYDSRLSCLRLSQKSSNRWRIDLWTDLRFYTMTFLLLLLLSSSSHLRSKDPLLGLFAIVLYFFLILLNMGFCTLARSQAKPQVNVRWSYPRPQEWSNFPSNVPFRLDLLSVIYIWYCLSYNFLVVKCHPFKLYSSSHTFGNADRGSDCINLRCWLAVVTSSSVMI